MPTLLAARADHYARNAFGEDGGFSKTWDEASFGPIPYAVPNPRARARALQVHDFHHVLTGYPTDWRGESMISAWELGSGGAGPYVYAWLIALFGFAVGLLALMILLFTTVAEAVGGPFYDKMAIHVLDRHAVSSREPGLIEGTVPDILRSLLFVIPAGVCWLLGFIPVVGIAFWVLGGAIVWLGFASASVNPSLMVTGHKLGGRVSFVFRFPFTMLGMGGVIALSMLVPLIGLIAIPSSIVGASELVARSGDFHPS